MVEIVARDSPGREDQVEIALIEVFDQILRQRLVETRVRFKRPSREDSEGYLATGERRGKAGGYAIQGLAGCFVQRLIGSYTNVVGLPLTEVVSLLNSEKFPIQYNWLKYAEVDRD